MISKWKIESLGNLISQQNVRNRSLDNIEVYSVTNSSGFTRSTEYFSKKVYSKNLSNYKLVARNQFAYNPSRINVGSIAYLSEANLALVSPLYIIFKVDEEKLLPEYLLRYLKSHYGNVQIRRNTQGSVRDSLKYSGLEKIKIPLPSLDDQNRITTVLKRVEKVITKRKESVETLEELLKSIFLEMFGDPKVNKKGFPMVKLHELYIDPKYGTKCGPFGSALKKDELVDEGIPVWNMDNITKSGQMILPFKMWITPQKYEELEAYSVLNGDIIISRAGTVGKMCVAKMSNKKSIISTNLIRVRFGNRLAPQYFVSLMNYCKGRIGRLKTGTDGSFTHMNTSVLDALVIPCPPLNLQNKFINIIEQAEKVRAQYGKSLKDMEYLKDALSKLAFIGELDFSNISVDENQQAIYADEEVIDTPIVTEEKKIYSTDELVKIIESFNKENFNFNELLEKVEDLFDETPEYETIKEQIFDLLNDFKIIQTFDEQKGEIVLKVNV